MRRSLAVLLLSAPMALTACPGTRTDPCGTATQTSDTCSPANLNQATCELLQQYYLYPELLASVSPRDPAYGNVSDYLAAMTKPARDAGKDRGWTYATSYASTQQYYDSGTSVGFGIGLLVREDAQRVPHLFVSQVYPGSPALAAGFVRGDEILKIGTSDTTWTDVPTLIAASPTALGEAFGPSTVGVTRVLEVVPNGGVAVTRTVSKATFGLDPVPEGWAVIPREGTAPAGYVALRTFINPANALLQEVFGQFKAAGVTDVVVDLRYNGGGLISTAELLANLLAGDRATSDVMFTLQNSPANARWNAPTYFAPGCDLTDPAAPICASAIGTPGVPFRVAFITTDGSASASELVPNALEPYHHGRTTPDIALVGAKTYGKPVGQRGFSLQQCDLALYVVSLRLVNAESDGDYFGGLPDANGNFSGPLCPAADDLTHAPGDAAEASTSAALSWLSTGACPPAPAQAQAKLSSSATSLRAASAAPSTPDAYPESPWPDEAQRNVRGLF